ncbi:FkbM family methyltransferase, partial [Alphaproteobacteria bacterium]|nr:FkbM family methyltransferase [Alphaproteobacteria bacterium]
MISNITKKIRYKLNFFPSFITYEGIKFTKIKQSSILKELYLTGFYENELIKFFNFFEYDFFWDIGANIGFFSFYVSKKKNWRVEAYEPYKLNCDYMKKLMVLNNINFNLNSLAVSDSSKEKKFYVPTKKSSSPLSSSATLNFSENEKYLKSKSFSTQYV